MLKKTVLTFGVLFSLLLLAGCPQQRSIAEIMSDPGRYHNKEVAVTGTVTKSFGALGTGVYQIDDGTGAIWVFSERTGVPSRGTRVASVGLIIPTVTFAGNSYATVLRERVRKH